MLWAPDTPLHYNYTGANSVGIQAVCPGLSYDAWARLHMCLTCCITTYVHKLRDETNMAGLQTLVYILSFPGHFHCQKSWQLQTNFRISFIWQNNWSCVEMFFVTLKFSQSLNHTSVGALCDAFFPSNNFCLTFVEGPAANICFHEQKSPVLSDWKRQLSRGLIRYTVWTCRGC